MNILPLLLGFLAFTMTKSKNPDTKLKDGFPNNIGSLLSNPDALGVVSSFNKLSDKNLSQAEKTSALMELVTNPMVFEVAKNFMDANKNNKQPTEPPAEPVTVTDDEPLKTTDTPKTESENNFVRDNKLFQPVEKIAGIEVSKQLYDLYDNWYVKK